MVVEESKGDDNEVKGMLVMVKQSVEILNQGFLGFLNESDDDVDKKKSPREEQKH